MNAEDTIREKYKKLHPILNEQQKRLWAATEAAALGYSGVSIVQRATGLSRTTIHVGLEELKQNLTTEEQVRIRKTGGGRKSVNAEFPGLLDSLKRLVEPTTRGDPMQPLLWTCKSTKNLSKELSKQGCGVTDRTVSRLLGELGYSLQSNRKTLEGARDPNRNSQFEYINKMVLEFQSTRDPVVSVDTKKKELVGNFKNAGQEWRPAGEPQKVNVHDFESGKQNVKAVPYGIYDVTWNNAWVNVGIDHDTAEFSVESLRKWWMKMGVPLYKNANRLLITADSGGSNSSRRRLWKLELQKFANETGLKITVCHLPPGTSKWNKIEHKLFCHITKNWRAQPLTSYEVIVNLISHTTTKNGLTVASELDRRLYPPGKKVSNKEMGSINMSRHQTNEKWNYTISPNFSCAQDVK